MKSMIWKELRENFKWAALAFFCLLLAEVFTISSYREAGEFTFFNVTLCGNAFLMVSAFGCSAIGAVLGSLQILPELRRDQWASLLHRPISRQAILFGKVMAGLMLYGLATGLPLLVSAVYVALPGRFAAPFFPGLAAPAASDLLLGVVFYFAAILIGLHSGGWFGSRGAIGFGAVAVLMTHLESASSMVLLLAAAAALFLAARGAMMGSLAMRGWVSRLAFGLMIFVGIETGCLLVGAAFQAGQDYSISFDPGEILIAHDGTVLLQKQHSNGVDVLIDENGNSVPYERYSGGSSGLYPLTPQPFADRQQARARHFNQGSRSSQGCVEQVSERYDGPELWYYLPRRRYFIGYDRLSRRCVGICDADGFKGPGAAPRPFASEPEREPAQTLPVVFWVGSKAFSVDFAERQMTLLLDSQGELICGVSKFPHMSDHPRIAIGLASEIRIFEVTGAPVYSLPYGYDLEGAPNVDLTATDNFSRTFVEYSVDTYLSPKARGEFIRLDVIDSEGKRIANYSVPYAESQPIPPTWLARMADALNMPVPLLAAAALWDSDKETHTPADVFAAKILVKLDRKGFYLLFGLAVVLGVIAFLWARRDGLTTARTITWVSLTLVFGLAGFLAYRISTPWPALVRCPRCAQRRPVNATECPHCHEPWEPLPASGAEIFDLARALTSQRTGSQREEPALNEGVSENPHN